MTDLKFIKIKGRLSVKSVFIPMGNDLCIVITGGQAPHLGAVAVAQVRKSLKDTTRLSSSTSVITLLGHKEDEVARTVAHQAAKNLGVNVVVCCGIHVDDITEAEMLFVQEYLTELEQFIQKRKEFLLHPPVTQ